jgi:hypothetical protein
MRRYGRWQLALFLNFLPTKQFAQETHFHLALIRLGDRGSCDPAED